MAADPRGLLFRRLAEADLPVCPLRIRNDLDVRAGLRLRRLVRSSGYDVIHFHTARAHALSPWLQGLQAKRVVTRRMDYPLKKGYLTRLLYIRSVDMIVAISRGVQAALIAGEVPAARICVIPSGIDTARFTPDPSVRARVRQTYGLSTHDPVALSVGALVERKGHHTVLAALRQLKEQGLLLHYLICGEGVLRTALETAVVELGLTSQVHFAGFCTDIPHFLAAADLFVHVPLYEGLGVAVLEAMAAGLPIVASKVGGIPDLIDDQITGLLVPPQDPQALAAAMHSMITASSRATVLARAARTYVCTRFDIAMTAQANERLYARLLR